MQMLIDLDQFSIRKTPRPYMNEFNNLAYIMTVLFIVVFVLNVLPAFAPPTWTTMSFIGLAIPNIDVSIARRCRSDGGDLRPHRIGEVVTTNRAAEIADGAIAAQRRCNQDCNRESASNDDWYILRLFAQPAAIELSVYCLWIDLTTNCVLGRSLLYWAIGELRVLDENSLHSW